MTVLQKVMNTLKLPDDSRTIVLFLIRHGEAEHNIQEKHAAQHAKEQALQEGLAPDEVTRRMEEARARVLDDPSLFDAPLSHRGVAEARNCREKLQGLVLLLQQQQSTVSGQTDVDLQQISTPTRVLVSPLQRALQTADLIFPDVENIHVREELRERITGLPCDSRHHSDELRNRKSFTRFSMSRLQMGSVILKNMPPEAVDDSDEEAADTPHQDLGKRMVPTLPASEDIKALRERTKFLFKMLLEFEETSIAVVSHKGYLRELERAQFGIMDSPLFGNGEVRVYRIKLSKRRQTLLEVERLG